MTTDGTHMRTKLGGPCSAGCVSSPGSELVIGQDGRELSKIERDP